MSDIGRLTPIPDSQGGRGETPVIDNDAVGLLSSILKELKILNLYHAHMTDNHITRQDVE